MKGYTALTQGARFKKPLNGMSVSEDSGTRRQTYTLSPWLTTLRQVFLFFSAFALGHFYGRTTNTIRPQMEELVPLGSVKQTFEYNRTYSSAPSNGTNGAWIDLFPKRGGFIEHPVLAPNISVVAVFHQLHCIDAIRHGYYMALNESREENLVRAGFVDHRSSRHVRHCFDYLRQSIMCHADTNVEPVIPELGGARGFGSEHTCRNFNELVDWMTNWNSK